MAEKISFPILPARWWWSLRTRFKQSVPPTVTASYLAAVLSIGQDTATKIALPAIRKLGLIDSNGKPQERAIKWRDDEQYADTCKDMLEGLYPTELLEAVPDPTADRGTAERWFANTTGAGESAVTKMVSFYQLLCEADPTKQLEGAKRPDTDSTSKIKLPKNSHTARARDSKPESAGKASHKISTHDTSMEGIPPALAMLIRSLPPEGTPLPEWRRKGWLRMANEALSFMYPDEADVKQDAGTVTERLSSA